MFFNILLLLLLLHCSEEEALDRGEEAPGIAGDDGGAIHSPLRGTLGLPKACKGLVGLWQERLLTQRAKN